MKEVDERNEGMDEGNEEMEEKKEEAESEEQWSIECEEMFLCSEKKRTVSRFCLVMVMVTEVLPIFEYYYKKACASILSAINEYHLLLPNLFKVIN